MSFSKTRMSFLQHTLNKSEWGFDPRSTIGSVALWLDATDNSTVLSSVGGSTPSGIDGSVQQWNDKSGNNNHCSNSTNYPIYKRDPNNGNRPGIYFSESGTPSNTVLVGGPLLTSTSYSIFVACRGTDDSQTPPRRNTIFFNRKVTTPSNSQNYLYLYSYEYVSASNRAGAITYALGNSTEKYYSNAVTSSSVIEPYIAEIIDDSVTTNANVFYESGTLITGSASGTTANVATDAEGYRLGARNIDDTLSDYLTGYIYEVLVFLKALTATERQQVEGYLSGKWNIPLNVGNTYANRAPAARLVTPTDITNCAFWIDAADRSSFTSNTNGIVQTVNDKSGNGRNLSNGYTSTQTTGFTWNVTKMNSTYPSFYYNSTQNRTLGRNTAFSISQPATMFIVLQPVGTASFQGVVDGTSSANRWYSFIFFPTTTTGTYRFFAGDTLVEPAPPYIATASPTVYSQYFNRANSSIYRNGTLSITGTAGTPPADITTCSGITLGSRFTSNTETFQGHIAEVIYYSRLLTTVERQEIEGYLAWKWGLQSQLPSTHPFASTKYPPNTAV